MASDSIPRLPGSSSCSRDGWELFRKGASHILQSWDLIHTAVVEEWGGHGSRAKLDHILSDLVLNCEEQWRARHDLHIDTLDVYLLECLEKDFGIEFEDDNEVTAVSLLLQQLYRQCAEGELDAAREWLQKLSKPEANRSQRVTGGDEDDESDSDGDGEEGGAPIAAAGVAGGAKSRTVDEDGWETVVAPRRRGAAGTANSSAASAPGAAASNALFSEPMSCRSRFAAGDDDSDGGGSLPSSLTPLEATQSGSGSASSDALLTSVSGAGTNILSSETTGKLTSGGLPS
jgi:pre-rRNA-processing protein TSR2